MTEPLHGVMRDTAGPGQSTGRAPAASRNTLWTTSYVAPPDPWPAAGPLPTRRAVPPAAPDLQDQQYAALAAWSASAETIMMGAVEAGLGPAYPRSVQDGPGSATRRGAAPVLLPRIGFLLAVLGVIGIAAVLVAGLW